ncbi:MAG: hypothetical protein M3Z24_15895 [Chloroflexota bacterium]|nr:hypothetical protein [Chloroflexota bacterium]
MSMSEFERELNNEEGNLSSLPASGQYLPDDFSEEDVAFARELDILFAPDKDEIPPYFVQTLLESEDARFQTIEAGFEHKMRARVFRRLKLRHSLFHAVQSSLRNTFDLRLLHRSFVAVALAIMLFMTLTVMITGPSFAAGVQILLQGAKVGVTQVHHLPNNITKSSHSEQGLAAMRQPSGLSLVETQQELHFSMYWPQHIPADYLLSNLYLYPVSAQSWADGPSFELDYTSFDAKFHTSSTLAIHEFKLKSDVNVLQVVKDGSAEAIKIDQSGRAQAIYVDGQWMMHNRLGPVWVYGQRSELIYQRDGIVFWIVGDPRQGIDKTALLSIANSLTVFNVNHTLHSMTADQLIMVTPLGGDSTIDGPFAGDVLFIYPDNNSGNPYVTVIDSSPTPKSQVGTHAR